MTKQVSQGPASAATERLREAWPWSLLRWRIERRPEPTSLLWHRAVAIAVAVGLTALAVQLLMDIDNLYGRVWRETFGSQRGIQNVLSLASPLILTGLAVALPYRMREWNIGGEGQFYMGAWAAAAMAFAFPSLAGPLLIALMLLAAAAGGGLWVLLPALARAYWRVNLVLTTLMLNFVALLWAPYWTTGAWRPEYPVGVVLSSRPLPDQAALPILHIGSIALSSGLIIGVAIVVLLWMLFRWTSFGYKVNIAGRSEKAGAYAGINVRHLLVIVVLISGALAGLAGVTRMTGSVTVDAYHFSDALSKNTGFMGIAVGVLAGGSFPGVLLMAILLAALATTGNSLLVSGVSSEFSTFGLAGVVLLFAAIGEAAARYRIVRW